MVEDGLGPHCLAILLSESVPHENLRATLFQDHRYCETAKSKQFWEKWGGVAPGVTLQVSEDASLPEWVVDLVPEPWPDGMGSRDRNSALHAAWSAGQFGRGTYPGSLERACEQAWAWPEASQSVGRHKAFLRIRACGTAVVHNDLTQGRTELLRQLDVWLQLVDRLLTLPESLAFLNPAGEVVLDQSGVRQAMNSAQVKDVPALDLWMGVRIFQVDANWVVMDMVGNSQFGEVDSETLFHGDDYSPDEVADFHWEMALKRILGAVTSAVPVRQRFGPGGMIWQYIGEEEGTCDPPRPVHRWFPKDGRKPPLGMYRSES